MRNIEFLSSVSAVLLCLQDTTIIYRFMNVAYTVSSVTTCLASHMFVGG